MDMYAILGAKPPAAVPRRSFTSGQPARSAESICPTTPDKSLTKGTVPWVPFLKGGKGKFHPISKRPITGSSTKTTTIPLTKKTPQKKQDLSRSEATIGNVRKVPSALGKPRYSSTDSADLNSKSYKTDSNPAPKKTVQNGVNMLQSKPRPTNTEKNTYLLEGTENVDQIKVSKKDPPRNVTPLKADLPDAEHRDNSLTNTTPETESDASLATSVTEKQTPSRSELDICQRKGGLNEYGYPKSAIVQADKNTKIIATLSKESAISLPAQPCSSSSSERSVKSAKERNRLAVEKKIRQISSKRRPSSPKPLKRTKGRTTVNRKSQDCFRCRNTRRDFRDGGAFNMARGRSRDSSQESLSHEFFLASEHRGHDEHAGGVVSSSLTAAPRFSVPHYPPLEEALNTLSQNISQIPKDVQFYESLREEEKRAYERFENTDDFFPPSGKNKVDRLLREVTQSKATRDSLLNIEISHILFYYAISFFLFVAIRWYENKFGEDSQ